MADLSGRHAVVITGAGRSGTSLAGGLFSHAGYYFGDKPLEPTESNPHGYFEDRDVNDINEKIIRDANLLTRVVSGAKDRLPPGVARRTPFLRGVLGADQRWLAAPRRAPGRMPKDVIPAVLSLVRHERICFKDPRFVQTLAVWRPYLPEQTAVVCMFREPATAVASMLKDASSRPYLAAYHATPSRLFKYWQRTYSRLLSAPEFASAIFVEYDQVLTGSAITRLERAFGCALDRTFVDPSLARSNGRSLGEVPEACQRLYRRLLHKCEGSAQ